MRKNNVFIFIEEDVAFHYGIGTYVQHLSSSLCSDFTVTVVKLFTKNIYTDEEITNNICYLNLPYLSTTDEEELRYFKRFVYIY